MVACSLLIEKSEECKCFVVTKLLLLFFGVFMFLLIAPDSQDQFNRNLNCQFLNFPSLFLSLMGHCCGFA